MYTDNGRLMIVWTKRRTGLPWFLYGCSPTSAFPFCGKPYFPGCLPLSMAQLYVENWVFEMMRYSIALFPVSSHQPPEFSYCSGCAVNLLDKFHKFFMVCCVVNLLIVLRLYPVGQSVSINTLHVSAHPRHQGALSWAIVSVQFSEPSLPLCGEPLQSPPGLSWLCT